MFFKQLLKIIITDQTDFIHGLSLSALKSFNIIYINKSNYSDLHLIGSYSYDILEN